MNLQDAVKALQSGDYDKVLVGSRYEEAPDGEATEEAYRKTIRASYFINTDAQANAARVIVLEQAVKALRQALLMASAEMSHPSHAFGGGLDDHPVVVKAVEHFDKARDATIAALDATEGLV